MQSISKITILTLAMLQLAACSLPTDSESKAGDIQYSEDVQQAVNTGDTSLADSPEALVVSALDTLESGISQADATRDAIYGTGENAVTSVAWDPTHDAGLLASAFGVNSELLVTNDNAGNDFNGSARALAIAGETSASRYAVFGSNPLRHSDNIDEGMNQLIKNTVSWLLQGNPQSNLAQPNIVMAHLDNSYYFRDAPTVRAWLADEYGDDMTINNEDTCEGSALSACINSETNLLIVSQVSENDEEANAAAASIEQAMKQGIPVLYVHHDGNLKALGKHLFKIFDVTYISDNYWPKERVTNFSVSSLQSTLPSNLAAIKTTVKHLMENSFTFNIADCESKCANIEAYSSEFSQGASAIKSIVDNYDKNVIDIFSEEGNEALKLIILYADALRSNIKYPMSTDSTDTLTWLQAYFADHVVYSARKINPVQKDLGTFSRSDFSHITATSKTITHSPKNGFRGAGVYAIPGQTVSITRTDSSDVNTHIAVNTMRSGSTHEWDKDKYIRPKYLMSQWLPIAPGETIYVTSPYGGPMQIKYNAEGDDVSFAFNNIGLHAYWASADDTDAFVSAMSVGDFDWAEISTPAFEIHSQLEKMRTSASSEHFPTTSDLAEGAMTYAHNYLLLLAGYQGPGIEEVPEIHNFAQENGLTIYTRDSIQHMNADQATCGYGCSGNPYDAYWSFSPIGHGDLHEVGHGLERSRFRFPDWETHTTTNPYSYYSKTRFFRNTGSAPSCQNLPFEDLFTILQTAEQNANPFEYMQTQELGGWNKGVGIYIQMMMAAQQYGDLADGWHLWARLHIIEREFNIAIRDEATWEAKKNGLGFSDYTVAEASEASNTDFMLIALSHGAKLDYSQYFEMWGFDNSDKAKQQVAGKSFTAMPKVFFAAGSQNYCESFDHAELNVDGTTAWPAE